MKLQCKQAVAISHICVYILSVCDKTRRMPLSCYIAKNFWIYAKRILCQPHGQTHLCTPTSFKCMTTETVSRCKFYFAEDISNSSFISMEHSLKRFEVIRRAVGESWSMQASHAYWKKVLERIACTKLVIYFRRIHIEVSERLNKFTTSNKVIGTSFVAQTNRLTQKLITKLWTYLPQK